VRITLVQPPLTQLNAPYPSIGYLARALRRHGHTPLQRDLGIELVLRLFSTEGLRAVFDAVEALDDALPEPAWRAVALRRAHERVADPVLAFLQGRDRTLATRILETPFLPTGPRLARADLSAFGPLAADDAARHLATLWLEDMADLVTSTLDDGFGLARYHHHLAAGIAGFDALEARLGRTTLVDALLDTLTDTLEGPVVGISVPFPGNLYGALRVGKRLRARGVHVVLGGGYVNTELRTTDEPRLWEYVDTLCLDDGEGPLLAVLDHAAGGVDRRHRTRTRGGAHDAPAPDVPAESAAWYGDLRLDGYLQLLDTLNPAHRLWSDGRWNKITLAHGCYWRRCSFCDITLDYVARFAPARSTALADQIEELVRDTGQRGVHFVDEAAPPRGLRDLALELLARDVTVTLWGNVRFERAYTPDLCRLLAAAGLVAVTGGLEVASDRLLARMEKGVTVEQVARAAMAFRQAGTMVHAYLMYGFPTQTLQETVDSAELVRQLFASGALSSAFWHRFVLTRHSGMYERHADYGIVIDPAHATTRRFARNDVPHLDPAGTDHDAADAPLVAMLAEWMRGASLDRPVHTWFPFPAPATTEPPDRVARALATTDADEDRGERLVWIGGDPLHDGEGRRRAMLLHGTDGEARIPGTPRELDWLAEVLDASRPGRPPLRYDAVVKAFPGEWTGFEGRWRRVRRAGMLRI
jgi:radical SAM superfamily enzyme YgiQ (UPF0313 family)